MDNLTLQDVIDVELEIQEIKFLGKRAFIRELSFQSQIELHKKFKGRDQDEASGDDICYLIGCVLCDEAGELLFDDPSDASSAMNRVRTDDLLGLFDSIKMINAMDSEEVVKK